MTDASAPSNLRLAEARDIVASGTSGKSLPVIEFMDAQQAEIERLTGQVRLLKRDNANLQASQEQLNAEGTANLVRLADAAWWRWLTADGDRCAGIVADAYKGWDTDTPWALTLKREIDHRAGFSAETTPAMTSKQATQIPDEKVGNVTFKATPLTGIFRICECDEADEQQTVYLCVAEATALRDWLTRALASETAP